MRTLIVILLSLCITCVATAQTSQLKQLHWLTGTWVTTMKNGSAYEIWQYVNDSSYQSMGYIKKANGDSIPQESVKLVYRSGKMFYIPTVPNQNNAQPVTFTVTKINDQGFVAENPEHDFPQRITYTLTSPGHLYASVDGTINGKFRKEEFNMVKNHD